MYKFFLVVCLAQVALGTFNVKINSLLDGQFAQINAILSQRGLHSVPAGDQTVGTAVIKGIVVSDIATLQRIGDAVMQTTSDNTIQLTSAFGLKSLVVNVASYTNGQVSFTNGTFDVASNEVSLGYSVSFTPTGGCSISVQELEITTLDKVTMFSDNPKMNNIDVSTQFQQVKQTINQFFKSQEFLNILQKNDPCKASSDFKQLFMAF